MRASPSEVLLANEARVAIERRRKLRWRHAWQLALFRTVTGVLAVSPRGTGAMVARALARLYFRLSPSRRRILQRNLLENFPMKSDVEITALANECIDQFGTAAGDFLEIANLTPEEILSRIPVQGHEHLAAARARGQGVFFLSAHFGNWEAGALVLGLLGEPIAVVARPMDNAGIERELARRRTKFGNRLISKHDAAGELIRAMRKNETVAVLIDQNVLENEAIFVPFFGRPTATTPSLARLQMKTGAAVVPGFIYPRGGGRWEGRIEPPIYREEFLEIDDRAERVRRATARYMEVIETAVRRSPASWMWMHNRWKVRPPSKSEAARLR
jgi:KDO2-lipid IV(A) lauroyltransferase